MDTVKGLLTDPECTGSVQDQFDAAEDSDAYRDATDPKCIADALAWQTRDLDRLVSRDSDEVTTWQ